MSQKYFIKLNDSLFLMTELEFYLLSRVCAKIGRVLQLYFNQSSEKLSSIQLNTCLKGNVVRIVGDFYQIFYYYSSANLKRKQALL